MQLDDASRFMAKVDRRANGCWIWTASIQRDTGYGRFGFGREVTYAHRAAWRIYRGEIPRGLFVCHVCDVRRCVNPAHLFLGTPTDNMRDASRKGRLVIPAASFASSDQHQVAKLSDAQVLEIRNTPGLLREFAAKFGVSEACISNARNYKTFREVA